MGQESDSVLGDLQHAGAWRAVLTDIINQTLDSRDRIDAETHRMQHEYLECLIEEHKRKKAFWDRIQRSAIGWILGAILSAVSAIGIHLYDLLKKQV